MDNAKLHADAASGHDTMPLIRLKSVHKSYHNNGVHIDVLNDLSFDILPGETIAVVGESGIGKSTLLHILGTLDPPDSGSLWFDGKNVLEYDSAALAKFRNQALGFVFQFHYLLTEFTAIENVMMPGLIMGQNRSLIRESAESILVRVGLKNRIHHRVVELSGGEQQRVALARALALKPVILLADEPTGNLDQKNSHQIHDLLVELNHEYNMTIVVVTHNMKLAGLMGKRLTLVDGKLSEINGVS